MWTADLTSSVFSQVFSGKQIQYSAWFNLVTFFYTDWNQDKMTNPPTVLWITNYLFIFRLISGIAKGHSHQARYLVQKHQTEILRDLQKLYFPSHQKTVMPWIGKIDFLSVTCHFPLIPAHLEIGNINREWDNWKRCVSPPPPVRNVCFACVCFLVFFQQQILE